MAQEGLTEEEIQQKYQQFQLFQQQIEQVSQHLEMLNHQEAELSSSINAVKELEKTPPGQEILTPIATGVFVRTELMDSQKMVVGVGADTAVEKKASDVARYLEDQMNNLKGNIIEANMVLQELSNQAMAIYKELEKHSNSQ